MFVFFIKDKLSGKQEEGVVKSEHKPYTGTAGIERFLSAFSLLLCLYLQYNYILFFLSLLSLGASKYCITQGIFMSKLKIVIQQFFCLHVLYECAQFVSDTVDLQVMAAGEWI